MFKDDPDQELPIIKEALTEPADKQENVAATPRSSSTPTPAEKVP